MKKIHSSFFILGIWNFGLVTWCFSQDVTLPGSASCGAGAVSGTWTVPCDVTAITVEVYGSGGGAGGGGGGSNGGFFNTRGGGGGGGGGYTSITINVTPGSSFSYSIGSGGCGGSNGSDASDGGSGSAGGNSAFTGSDAGGTPVNLSANGGSSGSGGDGTNGSPGSGGSGGNSSGGSTNTNGTAGNSGSGGNGGDGGNGAGPSGGAGGVGNTATGDLYGGGGAGGGNSQGGVGAAGGILVTFTATTSLPVTPIISNTAATCTAEGTSTISNYDPAMTYIFTPSGPSAGASGAITGMVAGTNYTVVAGTGNCASTPSAPFSNSAITAPAAPAITTVLPTCTSDGMSTINNYNGALTYMFTPAGPSVSVGGAITGMVTGTSYTVLANDDTCSSNPSASFSNAPQFQTPVVSVNSSDADSTICNGDNVIFTASPSGIANYDFILNGISVQSGSANTYSTSTLTNGNNITVIPTSNNGCAGTSTNSITFTVNPIPAITSFIASDDSICPGENVIFTANSSLSNSNFEFFNNGISVQDSSLNTFSSSTLIFGNSITVMATNTGCASTTSNAISVYVYPTPSVNISSNDADSAICTGDTVGFTANPNGYDSYNFSVNGALVQNTFNNTFTSFSLNDGDVISVTAVDFGCLSLASSISFTVNSFATANAGISATICSGNSYTLNGIIGGSATSSTWATGGSGTFDNSALASATYFPSSGDISDGNIVLTFTTNDPDGGGPCPAVSDTMILSINLAATANAGTNQTICADTTQSLNGNIGGSATSGIWTTGGNGTFDNAASLNAEYAPSSSDISNGSVTLTLTTNDPDGSGPCSAVSDEMILTINPLPTATLSSSQNTICAGEGVTFTASPSGMSSYHFFINGNSVQTGSDSAYTSINILNTDTITVITTNLGCGSAFSNAVSITVNPIPGVSLSVSSDTICQGEQVIFTASSATANSSYRFMNGFVELYNGPDSILPVLNLPPGNGVAVVATNLGCSSPPSNVISVTVNPLPNAIITSNPGATICLGVSAALTVSGGTNYLWNTGMSTAGINVSPTTATKYYVTVTDANGCKDNDSIQINVNQPAQVSISGGNISCNGNGTQITAGGSATYQWSPSAGLDSTTIANPIANPDTTTTYQVISTDLNTCKDSASITVIPSTVTLYAGADFSMTYGTSIELNPSGAQSYDWAPSVGLSCTNCVNPVANPTATTTYFVTGTDEYGCTGTDNITIEVIVNTEIFVPEAFSPNGDGENDKLFVRGSAIAEMYFAVYDRWGTKVFDTKNKNEGWDGKINGANADATVYVWTVWVKTVNDYEERKKGDVTLVR